MKILSLHHGHNSSVAYSENGVVKTILNEERFTRIKNHCGFPINSLNYIVEKYLANSLSKIDKIAVIDKSGLSAKFNCNQNFKTTDYLINQNELRQIYKKRKFFYNNFNSLFKILKNLKFKFKKKNYQNFKLKLYDHFNLPLEKIIEFDHHLSHAATFCYFDKYNYDKKYLIFTLDGEGDYKSSTVNVLFKNQIEIKSSISSEISLGYFYLYVTAYLGLKPGEHEYKVMGLAPYANKKRSDKLKEKLKNLFWLSDDGEIRSKSQSGNLIFELSEIFKFCRFDEIARASQEFLEELVIQWIKFWIRDTSIKNIAVSGGVFMNVKLNKLIHELHEVETFFPVPSCTDDSLPIGGLFLTNVDHNINIKKINNLYFGRSFSEKYINDYIENEKLENLFEIIRFKNYNDTNDHISKLLFENEVIGRFYGLEEFGARALGNRSILCNPREISNLSRINNFIKKRDFWMPFTPSIIEEEQKKYFHNPKKVDCSYMSCTFESTKLAKDHLKAAIHPIDSTIRPQVVKKNVNLEYHDLIKKFQSFSDVGALLNTSFNLSGYPNVSSPKNAIDTIVNSGLKYLVLGNNLLKKL